MASDLDSGKWALAGYLYQILATLSIGARGHNLNPGSTEEIDVLLDLADVGKSFAHVKHESSFGQDASLEFVKKYLKEDDLTVFVQFKFSIVPSQKHIGPSEVRTIVKRFDKSFKQATDSGRKVTACVLISNRQFSTRGRGGKALTTWNKEKNRTAHKYDLRLVLGYSLDKFRSFLLEFGQLYGLYEQETMGGIAKMIGYVMTDTAQMPLGAKIDKEDLVRGLVDHGEARPITADRVTPDAKKGLERWGDITNLVKRQQILNDLAKECTEHALIVLNGSGGCGKTVSLLKWLAEGQAIPAFVPLSEMAVNWIVDQVCDWANFPISHLRRSETTDRVLNRIFYANVDRRPPILCLGLDGLDEEFSNYQVVDSAKAIVNWFWDEEMRVRTGEHRSPRAVLIVTCRSMEEVIEHWGLQHDLINWDRKPSFSTLQVDKFSYEEMETALVEGMLERNISERIASTIKILDTSKERSYLTTSSPAASLVTPEIIDTIRHPVIWHSFANLDPVTQNEVLDGNESAINKLAYSFITRVLC